MMKWDGLVIILLIFTAYVTPYEVAFLSTRVNFMFFLNRFIDICFFLDMCKNFVTAYFDSEEQYWVGDTRRIAKRYLKSWFTVDLVSILPFDSVGMALQSTEMQEAQGIRLVRVLRLLKLMRLLRSLRILSRWQDQLGLTYVFRTFFKFVVLLLTMTHWMACMMRLIPDLFEYTDSTGGALSWLTENNLGGQQLSDAGPSRQYAVSLYWATMTLTTIGYGDVSATTDAESIYMTIAMFFSSILYAYTIGEATHLVQNMDETSRSHNRQSDMLNAFCAENGVPPNLAIRLREFFRHSKPIHRSNFYKNLMLAMSPTLQGEVSVFLNESLAKECYFLNADDPEERKKFLTAMTLQLKTRVFGPQEVVIKSGDRMECVYLVRHGLAFGGKGNFGKVYTVGRWFGAEGLLIDRRYTYEVRSLNFMVVETFSKKALDEILWTGDYPGTYRKMRRAIVKMVFVKDLMRASEVVTIARDAGESAGLHSFTKEESNYIRYGRTVPLIASVDLDFKASLGRADIGDVLQRVNMLENNLDSKLELMNQQMRSAETKVFEAMGVPSSAEV
jgi:hypothetical protein